LDKRCGTDFDIGVKGISGADYCPPIIVNAWNEWSEGAYLEPDEVFGLKKLEIIKNVFKGNV
jgi:hypothetical protein